MDPSLGIGSIDEKADFDPDTDRVGINGTGSPSFVGGSAKK